MSKSRFESALVDTDQPVRFSFNGRQMTGFAGDTLASALLANGQALVARSFKYHRPRGIFSAGSEEPNALVTLFDGATRTPNTRATMVPLADGLEAYSQNHRGKLERDFLALNDWLSPFLGAGFYYKTFMWPRSFWEKFYEPIIRSTAGLGELSDQDDPGPYLRAHAHCDLLVIGAGPAGLMAALSAGRSGARVILADEDMLMGGRLTRDRARLDQMTGAEWAAQAVAELESLDNVSLMPRTAVFGAYDHGIFGAYQQSAFRCQNVGGDGSSVWRIYARRAVVSAGATERPMAFANNDRVGVMLAGAVRSYVNRFGVSPGRRVAVFTNNDDGWNTAQDLMAQGVEVAAILDSRPYDVIAQLTHEVAGDVEVISDASISDTRGRKRLRRVILSNGRNLDVDCLAVSGGWNPNVHLTCHHRARPVWDDRIAAFVPGGDLPGGMRVAGAAGGCFSLAGALQEGRAVAAAALEELGHRVVQTDVPETPETACRITALWSCGVARRRAWVDLQNDVTTKDVTLAQREGFHSVEHLKRYTTLGMATDQGRTSNVLGLALLAEGQGKSIAETGTTIFRPPYTPVPIGALAGADRGKDFRPTRLTPAHHWARERGAVFVESGAWLRAQWFGQPGETHWRQTVEREVKAVRQSVGICDVSTLGKVDLKGRDVATFLNRVYANKFAKLSVGKVRYGLMLREDGVVMDDGTTSRLSDNHYLMTTTTANAGAVYQHLEFCLQCLWPELDVHLNSTTDAWAQFAVAGPESRKLLGRIVDRPFELSTEAFGFMACAELTVCDGTPARLLRVSFSGELAYEIAVPARFGHALAERLMQAGQSLGVTPYGTEALNVMRIEKGHAAGNELDGRNTSRNLNMEGFAQKPSDFIGKVLAERPAMKSTDQVSMVGLKPTHAQAGLSAGAHLVERGASPVTANDLGWISSAAYSPTFGHTVALGFLKNGQARIGERLRAWDGVRNSDVEVEVVSPHFYDPEGVVQRG